MNNEQGTSLIKRHINHEKSIHNIILQYPCIFAFYKVFEEKIFTPLGLSLTKFAATDPVPDGIVRGYIDLYSKLQVVESTWFSGWDYYTADGGLISNPYDMSVFFEALMDGHIINSDSLTEMLDWQTPKEQDPDFFPISYGLGIFKIETLKGIAYMHSGDAIGYYANMLYFPDDKTTVIYAVNSKKAFLKLQIPGPPLLMKS